MGSPELSRTVTEISALSPRRRVPSLPLSWHKTGGGDDKRHAITGSRNCTNRRGVRRMARHPNTVELGKEYSCALSASRSSECRRKADLEPKRYHSSGIAPSPRLFASVASKGF